MDALKRRARPQVSSPAREQTVVKPPEAKSVATAKGSDAMETPPRLLPQESGTHVTRVPKGKRGDWLSTPSLKAQLRTALEKWAPSRPVELTGVAAGASTKASSARDASLIGLANGFFDPKASYEENLAAFKAQGVPRFELLSPAERAHETAFAAEVEADIEHYVQGADILSVDTTLKTCLFEVDAMKRLYDMWGAGSSPAGAGERQVRAEANHALHPAAVAVARLAFLKRLDELAALPEGDPKRNVFVTAGGCAAGKGNLSETLRRQHGEFPFGAVWDAAGEGDALENAWVLEACEARGLKSVYGFAANDPKTQYQVVLERGLDNGRTVDVMTFTNSYVEGTKNMKAFLESPAYLAAHEKGTASALGLYMGRFDPAARTDKSIAEYPDLELLGQSGRITAADVPETPPAEVVLEEALVDLEQLLSARQKAGLDTSQVLLAALLNAEKFTRTAALERA